LVIASTKAATNFEARMDPNKIVFIGVLFVVTVLGAYAYFTSSDDFMTVNRTRQTVLANPY
jgi:hypothetical protein